jgi:EAL and modified HD-GYP domain-containing signal transduction protein
VLLSGNFYSQPITKGAGEISPLKINALHLLGQINDESFDLGATADTIERDPALSISLLRFINTMNPDRSRKIDSIRNAVAILGQNEVKKWANVAISVGIGEDRPSEITRLSLIRAKFAENLAPLFNMALSSGSLFISGLFSLLDVILQMPLSDAFDEVAVDNEIRDSLVNSKGRIYEVLALIFAYERADWHNASIIMVRNGIDIAQLSQAFLDSLYWYRQLLDAIDDEEEYEVEGETGMDVDDI